MFMGLVKYIYVGVYPVKYTWVNKGGTKEQGVETLDCVSISIVYLSVSPIELIIIIGK